jgi:hypothetical protein
VPLKNSSRKQSARNSSKEITKIAGSASHLVEGVSNIGTPNPVQSFLDYGHHQLNAEFGNPMNEAAKQAISFASSQTHSRGHQAEKAQRHIKYNADDSTQLNQSYVDTVLGIAHKGQQPY